MFWSNSNFEVDLVVFILDNKYVRFDLEMYRGQEITQKHVLIRKKSTRKQQISCLRASILHQQLLGVH